MAFNVYFMALNLYFIATIFTLWRLMYTLRPIHHSLVTESLRQVRSPHFVFGRPCVQISTQRTAFLAEVFSGFPSVVPQITLLSLPSTPFPIRHWLNALPFDAMVPELVTAFLQIFKLGTTFWVYVELYNLPLPSLQFPTVDFCGYYLLSQGFCAQYWLTLSRCAYRQYTKDRFRYAQIHITL